MADPAAVDEVGLCRGLPGRVVAQERGQGFAEVGGTGWALRERIENLPVPAGEPLTGEGSAEGVFDQPVEVLEPVPDRPAVSRHWRIHVFIHMHVIDYVL